jgi:hypothetical protein
MTRIRSPSRAAKIDALAEMYGTQRIRPTLSNNQVIV